MALILRHTDCRTQTHREEAARRAPSAPMPTHSISCALHKAQYAQAHTPMCQHLCVNICVSTYTCVCQDLCVKTCVSTSETHVSRRMCQDLCLNMSLSTPVKTSLSVNISICVRMSLCVKMSLCVRMSLSSSESTLHPPYTRPSTQTYTFACVKFRQCAREKFGRSPKVTKCAHAARLDR